MLYALQKANAPLLANSKGGYGKPTSNEYLKVHNLRYPLALMKNIYYDIEHLQ